MRSQRLKRQSSKRRRSLLRRPLPCLSLRQNRPSPRLVLSQCLRCQSPEAQTQPELSSAPAKESAPSVEQKTDDAVSAGPLPVLGSQSRSRSNSAPRPVSAARASLQTLRTTKPLTQAAPADVEDVPTAVPAEETKPVILEAEPTAEPTVAIAEVAAEALEATRSCRGDHGEGSPCRGACS